MPFSNIYVNPCVQLNNLHLLYFVENKKLFITTNNPQNSPFPCCNNFVFTKEDGSVVPLIMKTIKNFK